MSRGIFHDRSPLIVPASFCERWLEAPITDRAEVQAMVNSIPESHLYPYRMSTEVNNVRNNRPDLLCRQTTTSSHAVRESIRFSRGVVSQTLSDA